MSRIFATCLALAATAAIPSVAAAQDRDIVVEGITDVDGNKARMQADAITPRALANTDTRPRFQRPVCAGVWGLSPATASAIIDRIHDNALKADVPVSDNPDCKANVWAIFVDDPGATFSDLRDDNGWMVRLLSRADRNRVERQEGPVRAWNLEVTRDRDGAPVASGFEYAAQAQAIAVQQGGGLQPIQTYKMTRLHNPVRRDIETSVVMIDRDAIVDMDTHTLADYVSMRALARTQEPKVAVTYDTILNIFKEGARADRITAFDRAYLESLYDTDPHRPARMSMPSFVKVMEAELARGNN